MAKSKLEKTQIKRISSNNYNTIKLSSEKAEAITLDTSKANTELQFNVSGHTYKCLQCSYKAQERYLMIRHCRRHDNIRNFDCPVCGYRFKSSQHLKHHMRIHTGSKPYQCEYCDGSYKTAGDLLRHTRYKHTHEKPHKCTECSYAAVERSKLARHMRCHTGERPYQCSHCTYASSDSSQLKRHCLIHAGEKPFKCGKCHTQFTQKNSLKTHMLRVHTKKRQDKYSCNVCHARYLRKCDLRLHVQNLHTSAGLLFCKKCNACFNDRYSLRDHVKSHKHRKTFKCDTCMYATWTRKLLMAHIQSHKKELFKCEKCSRLFFDNDNLIRHTKVAHDCFKSLKFVCNECGKLYLSKCSLVQHIKTNCGRQDPDVMAIAKHLNNGEVIILPEKNFKKYVMVEKLPNEISLSHRTDKLSYTSIKGNSTLKELYVEIENNRLLIRAKTAKINMEMTDDEEPFFGF